MGAQLTPVDALVATKGERYVLAMLSQHEEGRYFLEDLSGTVPIDLSDVVRPLPAWSPMTSVADDVAEPPGSAGC